jgi:acyl-homoserine-lactone acylase
LGKLQEFYDPARSPAARVARLTRAARPFEEPAPTGSNGFAIAPSLSASGHALLWINPHTSYYFRSELQMVSDEGLNVYGAVTWGQFFVYQGWNTHNGWMHTSYGGDAIDEYVETIVKKPDGLYYEYGDASRKLQVSRIRIAFRQPNGATGHRDFTVYHSHHGPIIRAEARPPADSPPSEVPGPEMKWIAVKLLEDPVPALAQSYLRTKTANYQGFLETQQMRTDTSNNTVYADADGNIAYFHGNFIPKRDTRFDFTHPVDGSNPATEWQGPHPLKDTITLLNPKNGWIQNTNNWPFSAAGAESPKRENYPKYMWIRGENPRGIHAVEVLQHIREVTLDSLIAAGYDSHLTAFDVLLPPLFEDYEQLPADDPRRTDLKEPIDALRHWDRRTAADSVPTALAIFWGNALRERKGPEAREADEPVYDYLVGHLTAAERIEALGAAVANSLGRHQPLSALDRRHRAAFRRRETQPARRLRLLQLGRAGLIRAVRSAHHQAHLRIDGQQLRRGGGIRAERSRQGHHERRRKRRPRLAPLHRSGGDVRARHIPRRAIQPRRGSSPRGAHLPPVNAAPGGTVSAPRTRRVPAPAVRPRRRPAATAARGDPEAQNPVAAQTPAAALIPAAAPTRAAPLVV